jgi:hypothetical protein
MLCGVMELLVALLVGRRIRRLDVGATSDHGRIVFEFSRTRKVGVRWRRVY